MYMIINLLVCILFGGLSFLPFLILYLHTAMPPISMADTLMRVRLIDLE